LINVVVEPESNRTFSNLLDLTADIVSTTIIVIGARLVRLGSTLILLMVPCSSLLRRSSRDDESREIFVVGLGISL
jgi:hypothetical protein